MDLLDELQQEAVRQAMTDIGDTFQFPIIIRRTSYEDSAFASSPHTYAEAATGTVTYGDPADGDTLTVDGNTFTKVAAAPGANEFTDITELTALIEALASVNATDDGEIITIVAAATGPAGNAITLAKTGAALELSGATLAGGQDDNGIPLFAIRNFASQSEIDRFRNRVTPAPAHEIELWVSWAQVEEAELNDGDDKILLDHNDLVEMSGEIYEIQSVFPVGDLTKRPTWMYMRIKMRWQNKNGEQEA